MRSTGSSVAPRALPDDYVLATGQSHTVREFLAEAAALLDIDWEKHTAIDENYFRPAEVDALRGDPGKARQAFGWQPTVAFHELIRIMVNADVKQLEDRSPGAACGYEPSCAGSRSWA